MPGVADDQAAGRLEEGCDDRSGEDARARTVPRTARSSRRTNSLWSRRLTKRRISVRRSAAVDATVPPCPSYVGQQEARDAAGGAARRVVNVAAALGLLERLAVDPGVQAAEDRPSAVGELAASPHFHALHLLRWFVAREAMMPELEVELGARWTAPASGSTLAISGNRALSIEA